MIFYLCGVSLHFLSFTCQLIILHRVIILFCFVFFNRIVKFNYFLSFAGLHLFLQTELPIKEIEGFLEGKYGESVSVEELIQERVLENEEDKAHISCSNENCTVMTSPNWNISSSAEDDIGSIKSSSGSYNSVESLPEPLSSSLESCSFYSVYRWYLSVN